jgi:glycosyltransferase involved in cell wall biosynthesis
MSSRRVVYFGSWEQGHPRNEQAIAALRSAGVEVQVVHEDVWTSKHKFAVGPAAVPRLLLAELRLGLAKVEASTDALIVGYPGQFDLLAARIHRKPVVFNPMVSLYDSLVDDRKRFRPGSLAAQALRNLDIWSFRAADVLVADTQAHAAYMAELADIELPTVCYVGAEERLFKAMWRPRDQFHVLFVGKLIPLHGIDVILEAARQLPNVHFRIVGSGQLDHLLSSAPTNVEHVSWIDYPLLPKEYAVAGCALGIFGSSDKAQRVIPNKAFQALAVGTPLITADTAAARELLADGRDALLVEPSPQAIADAVRLLRDRPETARRIGNSGRLTFERQASERVLGPRWVEAVQRAIDRRR